MSKLSRTSVQLPPKTLEWFDNWPRMTRSEAIRLALERTEYLCSLMPHVEELADRYKPVLAPALEELNCDNYRTVVRLLDTLVGSYIQEKDNRGWKDENTGDWLDTTHLYQEVEKLNPLERIYLLDCIVARRDWTNDMD